MNAGSAWKSLLDVWPAELPREGMLVLTTQESIPFVDFLASDAFVIVERDRPDASGARKQIVALASVVSIKLLTTEPLEKLGGFAAATGESAGTPYGRRATDDIRRRASQATAQFRGT